MDDTNEIAIEQYILGTMDDEELRAFEKELGENPNLQQEYEATLAARNLIKEAGRIEMKETLDGFEMEAATADTKSTVMPLWMKRALPIAAMLVLFFSLYQFGVFNTAQSGGQVFEDYFEIYAAPGTLRTNENDVLENWKSASNLYKEQQYAEALLRFQAMESEVPAYLSSFYAGMSALSMEPINHEIALVSFNKVLDTDNDYVQQARWYKALILLATDRTEEGKVLLEQIVANKTYNHEKASEILELNLKN